MIGKKAGAFQIKYMPSGKTCNDIRSYMKEYEIKMGHKIDILLVDYMDLLLPLSKKISAENLFVKDKYVSEELRNLAMEKNCVCVTAAQLNRGAVEEIEYDHSHISGGLSKIQTADNVFGIFTSKSMRERGEYQIQLMKTRSSSGVGMKISLDFDIDTLRITDSGREADDSSYTPSSSKATAIIDSIKSRDTAQGSQSTVVEDTPKIAAKTDSTRLREFLNGLGGSED
jgi:hypothetical protein